MRAILAAAVILACYLTVGTIERAADMQRISAKYHANIP